MQPPERTLTLRPRVTIAEDSLRPTRAEIDLDALVHNLAIVRAEAAGARVLAVVKADAYGHGVVPVVTRLAAEGVAAFGVALAEEGLELREAGIDAPILVLNGVYAGAHREVLEAGLTPVVFDLETVHAFSRVRALAQPEPPGGRGLRRGERVSSRGGSQLSGGATSRIVTSPHDASPHDTFVWSASSSAPRRARVLAPRTWLPEPADTACSGSRRQHRLDDLAERAPHTSRPMSGSAGIGLGLGFEVGATQSSCTRTSSSWTT